VFLWTGPGALGAVPPRVEIVFCLDLSASTNGLIDRFRDHLWDYTRLMAQCSPQPAYRIGVVGFSRPSFRRETGYVRVLKDLTTDIESIGGVLDEMRSSIEKGDQFVGHALIACAKEISWSADSSTLKILFLVGNGRVNQGGTDYRKAAGELAEMGVQVNTLFCTTRKYSRTEAAGWAEIAAIGGGSYSAFSVSSKYVGSTGSLDLRTLHGLNDTLNRTYLYYGPAGRERWQLMQDLDARLYFRNPEGYVHRVRYKISALYQKRNSSWDLVDLLLSRGNLRQADFEPAQLPDPLRTLDDAAFKAVVNEKKIERLRMLYALQDLLDDAGKKNGNSLTEKKMQTLDILTGNVIRALLEKRGYFCTP
jgi:hypothetical protein